MQHAKIAAEMKSAADLMDGTIALAAPGRGQTAQVRMTISRTTNMNRRNFLSQASGVAALPVCLSGAPKSPQPNIIFILTDDQRWDALGCLNHPFVKTPNLDRIRREGALFSNSFVTTSLCSPSRASFLTGTYAHRHGVIDNTGREFEPGKTPSFPELLQARGYETAFIGKWHMAPHANPRRGFDYWLSFRGQGVYTDPTLNENGREFQAKGLHYRRADGQRAGLARSKA